jgi:hypothetical protein
MGTPLRLLIIEGSENDALLLESRLTKNGYEGGSLKAKPMIRGVGFGCCTNLFVC